MYFTLHTIAKEMKWSGIKKELNYNHSHRKENIARLISSNIHWFNILTSAGYELN